MKQLGILDSAFINMEHKNVPQHIGSFGIYDQSTAPDGKVRFKSVIKHFEHQIKKIPLFRTRLIQAPGRFARPYWLVDDDFDVEFHLRHIALPYPGDWRQLCIMIARLHSRPIDMNRPLWESYVIEGLDNIEGVPKGCFVIYTKIHHSIVDGGGADEFMAAIHDLEPMVHEDEEDEVYEGEEKPSRSELLKETTKSYYNNAWSLTKGGFELSSEVGKSALKLAKGELKAPPMNAPDTRFNAPVTAHRVIEACDFDFEDIRSIKGKTDTKVNDVALSIISGAMRKYLDTHNEHPNTSLVASVPMNMRSRNGDTGEANQVGSIFTSLNSTIDDPLARLIAIHKSTDEAKDFAENAPLKDALKLAGAMSPRLTKRLIDTYVDNQLTRHLPMKINTVISNVPGPNFPLYCSGAKLIRYHGLGVLTPGVGIFHLIFTYCGKMSITVLADREMLPDPSSYRACMEESFKELKDAVDNATEEEIKRHSYSGLTLDEKLDLVVQKAEEVPSVSAASEGVDEVVAEKKKPKAKRKAKKSSDDASTVTKSDEEKVVKPKAKRAAKKSAAAKAVK